MRESLACTRRCCRRSTRALRLHRSESQSWACRTGRSGCRLADAGLSCWRTPRRSRSKPAREGVGRRGSSQGGPYHRGLSALPCGLVSVVDLAGITFCPNPARDRRARNPEGARCLSVRITRCDKLERSLAVLSMAAPRLASFKARRRPDDVGECLEWVEFAGGDELARRGRACLESLVFRLVRRQRLIPSEHVIESIAPCITA